MIYKKIDEDKFIKEHSKEIEKELHRRLLIIDIDFQGLSYMALQIRYFKYYIQSIEKVKQKYIKWEDE